MVATLRGRGWEFLHVCIDDASGLAFTEILPADFLKDNLLGTTSLSAGGR